MKHLELIDRIKAEPVEYRGPISFASRGINPDVEGLLKAFHYGFSLGVECTKEDVLRLLRLENNGISTMYDWEAAMLRKD